MLNETTRKRRLEEQLPKYMKFLQALYEKLQVPSRTRIFAMEQEYGVSKYTSGALQRLKRMRPGAFMHSYEWVGKAPTEKLALKVIAAVRELGYEAVSRSRQKAAESQVQATPEQNSIEKRTQLAKQLAKAGEHKAAYDVLLNVVKELQQK